ncbi:hypothetical protein C8034_v008997 [Colletotrichum sidae]|uniref:N-acetyltransferase domain-containing protein n=1 Tax=Colletotrichum sidae TaxID=1347389 RepID=A0A4R8TLY2_9PEZI|nr:hypothetical protein C8034_v008997 [Colletotrichum sidae]
MATRQVLETGPMTREVLDGIFASDQDMYPAPLTWERLESWTKAAPEMAICFHLPSDKDSTGKPVGAVIALPMLVDSWRELITGVLKETDVEPTMFPCEDDHSPEVGLHVFHVERFDVPEARGRVRGFGDISMQAVVDAALRKRWKVLGHSALTATPEGRRCFEKLGLSPTGYEEYWVSSASSDEVQLVTVSVDNASEVDISQDRIKGHARMLAKHIPPTDAI